MKKITIQMKSVVLEQRMGNERPFVYFCGIIRDLIIVSFRSKVMIT